MEKKMRKRASIRTHAALHTTHHPVTRAIEASDRAEAWEIPGMYGFCLIFRPHADKACICRYTYVFILSKMLGMQQRFLRSF